jgi:hypothetical protein
MLYNAAFLVPGSYNERLGLIAGVAAFTAFFALLGGRYWTYPEQPTPLSIRQSLSKAPFVICMAAFVPPASAVAWEIIHFFQTGQWTG